MQHNDARAKVVQFPKNSQPRPLDPGLEELRRLINEATPTHPELPEEDVPDAESLIRDVQDFNKRYRAGYGWRKHHRRKLLTIKYEHGLSDSEIRGLRQVGAIRWTPCGVKLALTQGLAVSAAILAFALLILAICTAVLIYPQLTTLSLSSAIGWALLGGYVSAAIYMYRTHIRPWRNYRALLRTTNRTD